MDKKMVFSFKDFGSICRRAFSLKKMLTISFFMVFSMIIFILFSRIALLTVFDWNYICDAYGICPFFSMPGFNWLGFSIYGIGFLLSFWIFSLGRLGCARITIKELKGDYFFSTLDAIRYSFRNSFKVLMSFGLIILLLIFLLIGGIITAFIFKIPFVGELFHSLAIWLILPVSLVFVLIGIVFLFGLRLIPVLSGIVQEDFFEVVYQLFSTVTSQPIRVIFYMIITDILSFLGFIVWSIFLMAAYVVYFAVFSLAAFEKLSILFYESIFVLNNWLPVLLLKRYIPEGLNFHNSSITMGFSAYIFAIVIIITIILAFSYCASVKTVGDTVNSIIIRYLKDEEDLTEENEEEIDFDEELKQWEEKEEKKTQEEDEISEDNEEK